MNTPPFLSIVVPCYYEEESLPELYRRLTEVCAPYAGQGYEIVLVNDGSKDNTWPIICGLQAADTHIVGVSLSRNFGHSMALAAGLDVCRGERVMIIDADLQDPPELLPEMLAVMEAEQADVVYGKRLRREGETWFKRVSASVFYRLVNQISDVPMPKDTGDFRLVTRRVVEALKAMPESARYTRGMVAWIGYKQVPLKYERKARFAGTTHYTLDKMLRLALDGITSFSTRPLRLGFYLGFVMILLSFVLMGYIAYSYIMHDTVRGWASLGLMIAISQAVQWMMLGLIGEYVGRIYQESKHRPKYLVSEVVGL